MSIRPGRWRSVVMGAGLSGLAAAAALRGGGAEVVVVERDRLPDDPQGRKGVPQGGQLHNLLTRAQRHLDELLPGFLEALLTSGGSEARVADETHVYEFGRVMPSRDLELSLMCAPRPLIDHVARRCLEAAGGVTIVDQTNVVGIDFDGSSIGGVRVADGVGVSTIDADLVIDCLGPGSRTPDWLHAAGLSRPPATTVAPGQWYVSIRLRRPEPMRGDPRFWLSFPTGVGPGALLSPAGPAEWHLSVSGGPNDQIPRRIEEIRSHLALLPDPAIGEAVSEAAPVSTPHVFRKTTATWRRYDELAVMPAGLLCLGDSVAALNPLFGQGMSLAAWQASELAAILTDDRSGDRRWVTDEHRCRVGATVDRAWNLGGLVERTAATLAEDRHGDLGALVASNVEIHRCYVGVWHLIDDVDRLHALLEQESGSAGVPPSRGTRP